MAQLFSIKRIVKEDSAMTLRNLKSDKRGLQRVANEFRGGIHA